MRYRALSELGYKEVPDEWVKEATGFTEEEKKAFIIIDNIEFGESDFEMLANEWDENDLKDWGLELPFNFKGEAEEDNYVIPDEIETDIITGDLFEIGQHRLLCGDSTKADDVEKVMGGQKASVVFTDPPYGVNVKGGNKGKKHISGDLTQVAIPFSFDLTVTIATTEDARLYFCGGEGNLALYDKLFDRFLQQMPRHLIWVKNGIVMKPNNYHNQYEIIYYGYKPKGGSLDHWFSGRTQDEASDVWQIKRDASSDYLHPTQKPVALPSRAIKNSSKVGDIVYDPFLGSGSTMAAAHQLDRKCFGNELDPHFCQIILDRMLNLDPTLEVKRNGKVYRKKVKKNTEKTPTNAEA